MRLRLLQLYLSRISRSTAPKLLIISPSTNPVFRLTNGGFSGYEKTLQQMKYPNLVVPELYNITGEKARKLCCFGGFFLVVFRPWKHTFLCYAEAKYFFILSAILFQVSFLFSSSVSSRVTLNPFLSQQNPVRGTTQIPLDARR